MTAARSDIFSFKRWSLLVSKHWTENRKKYGLFLLASTGLLVAWYSFMLIMGRSVLLDVTIQFGTYFAGLYLAGCLYASTLFAELTSKQEGITYLTLPASQLEKLLCVLLYGVVIFFAGYTLVFYLVDIPMVEISNHILEKYPRYIPNSTIWVPTTIVYNIFTAEQGALPEKGDHVFLLGFFSIQAIFILGSLYFRRYALIKSIIVVLACLLAIILVEEKLVNFFLPKRWHTMNFSWIQFDEEGHPSRFVYLPGGLADIIMKLLQYGIPVLIWIITYHRLKEKEI